MSRRFYHLQLKAANTIRWPWLSRQRLKRRARRAFYSALNRCQAFFFNPACLTSASAYCLPKRAAHYTVRSLSVKRLFPASQPRLQILERTRRPAHYTTRTHPVNPLFFKNLTRLPQQLLQGSGAHYTALKKRVNQFISEMLNDYSTRPSRAALRTISSKASPVISPRSSTISRTGRPDFSDSFATSAAAA